MSLLVYLILSLGVCYAWSDTEAARPFRNFVAKIPYVRTPLLCHECSSFWISLFLTLFINPLNDYTYSFASNILSAFCGFFINLYFVRKKIIPLKD